MLKRINVNCKALEQMLFIWASIQDKMKIQDEFFIQLAETPEMDGAWGEGFDRNGFRKVLSAVSNREIMSDATQREKRFWNNNMWMTEDLEFTQMMLEPVKTLNLNDRIDEIPADFPYEEVEVVFYPGTTEVMSTKDNRVFINFFKVMIDLFDEDVPPKIEGETIPDFCMKAIASLK